MDKRKRILPVVFLLLAALLLTGCTKRAKETDEITTGIDVARYQGTIDWTRVATSSVDFAMVRLGYRSYADGSIVEDPNARYNLQEAQKNNIMLGAYFFSSAVNTTEAVEEANWAADILDHYSINYPIAYDCEGFLEETSRQYDMSVKERTDVALAFLKQIEKRGYEGMFYASKNDMEKFHRWDMSRIEKHYKVWVAQYPEVGYPTTEKSSYTGPHAMWQHTTKGVVPGITQNVDLDVAYFGYAEINPPVSDVPPEEAKPDVEAMMTFEQVNELVRIAISSSGWSKLEFEGNIYYAVSNLLTTDFNYTPAPVYEEKTEDDGVTTRFVAVQEQVTAKIEANLRTLPSVDHPDCKIVTLLKNGTVVTRTGINEELGWSRLDYNGQTVYCVSSLLKVVE